MFTIKVPSNSDHITSRWCVEQLRGTLHFLLYHRLQIPVPYLTLGVLVDQLKNLPEGQHNFFLDKHRSAAIHTHKEVQRIVELLEGQVISRGVSLDYVAVAFGPTAMLAKEVWFVRLPEIDRDHRNENHLGSLQRTVANTVL